MWNPTHLQVTVLRAKNLITKGKNGTNSPFVTIAVGKEKYQTSVKEKTSDEIIAWQEQCELSLMNADNTTALVLTALHKNGLVDQFLGTVSIPMSSLDIHGRPKARWYKLEGKPSKDKGKTKERGEIEVRIAFTVKAVSGSLSDLSKRDKHKSSLSHLSAKVGGSLLSLGSSEKRAGLKQITKSIGKKLTGKKRDANGGDGASEKGSQENIHFAPDRRLENVDPGVISEDEDEFTFDNLSHKSSGSSLNVNNAAVENLAGGELLRKSMKGPPAKPPRITTSPTEPFDEWEQKLRGRGDTLKRAGSRQNTFAPSSPPISTTPPRVVKDEAPPSPSLSVPETPSSSAPVTPSPKPAERRFMSSPSLPKQEVEEVKETSKFTKRLKQFQPYKKEKKDERFIVGEESIPDVDKVEESRLSREIQEKFRGQSRDDLIETVIALQASVQNSGKQVKELEDYLDQLLLRVMESTPRLLQKPFSSCGAEFKSH